MFARRNPIGWSLLLMAAALSCAGCGGRTYEMRLEETKKYYTFIELQNVNLAPTWKSAGMSMRVPIQYQVMPGPALIKDPKNPKAKPVKGPDRRQPEFLGDHKLPGLIAAWKADYSVSAAGEKAAKTLPGYLYLLSNYELFTDPDAEKEQIEKFHGFAVGEFCQGLKASPPAAAKWVPEKRPRAEDHYNAQKVFTSAKLDPPPLVDGVPYDATLYLQSTKDVHVVLISLIPQGTTPLPKKHLQDASLGERFDFALETFSNDGTKPAKGTAAGAGQTGGPTPPPF